MSKQLEILDRLNKNKKIYLYKLKKEKFDDIHSIMRSNNLIKALIRLEEQIEFMKEIIIEVL